MNSQPGASPKNTIKYIREDPLFDFVKFVASERWPILDTNFRYRNLWKTWSYVSAMEIFLLNCSGYTQTQISRWLRVSQWPINEFNRKLNKAGVPLRWAPKPQDFLNSNATGFGAQELNESERVKEIMSNVKRLIDQHQRVRHNGHRKQLQSDIDYLLSRLHQRRDMKHEHRTSVQRYRSMTGENLDTVILSKKKREYGGKVGSGPKSTHEDEALAFSQATRRTASGSSTSRLRYVDDLLLRYWTGKWSYDKAYQYGMFTNERHEQRFEASLRKRCLKRCKKRGLPECATCLSWLQNRGSKTAQLMSHLLTHNLTTLGPPQ